MTPKQLLRHFGGAEPATQAKAIRHAAHHLGYTAQAVTNWVKIGRIPLRAQVIIDVATAGKLKASKK